MLRLRQTLKSGHLFKRSSKDRGDLVWCRKLCILQETALVYYRGWDKGWTGFPLVDCSVDVVEPASMPKLLEAKRIRFCLELAMPHRSVLVRRC